MALEYAEVEVGDEVLVSKVAGIVKYVGLPHFANGVWIGIKFKKILLAGIKRVLMIRNISVLQLNAACLLLCTMLWSASLPALQDTLESTLLTTSSTIPVPFSYEVATSMHFSDHGSYLYTINSILKNSLCLLC